MDFGTLNNSNATITSLTTTPQSGRSISQVDVQSGTLTKSVGILKSNQVDQIRSINNQSVCIVDDLHMVDSDIVNVVLRAQIFDELDVLRGLPMFAARTPPENKNKFTKRAGAKQAKKLERLESVGFELIPKEATMFRALSARCNYLAQDRVDIAYSAKELCREFAIPTKKSNAKLKRLVRYLVGAPRLLYTYPFQDPTNQLDVYVDTDFAGCKSTRRSTSGGAAMHGKHHVKHWSKTQTTVCLSSGEAELRGISDGLAQAIGLQSIARDLGITYHIKMWSDATAAIGIARRRGMGKIRHLDVMDLWVQEKFTSKAASIDKVLGTENPADILTKYVERAGLTAALAKLGVLSAQGKSSSALEAMGARVLGGAVQPP